MYLETSIYQSIDIVIQVIAYTSRAETCPMVWSLKSTFDTEDIFQVTFPSMEQSGKTRFKKMGEGANRNEALFSLGSVYFRETFSISPWRGICLGKKVVVFEKIIFVYNELQLYHAISKPLPFQLAR